MQRVGPTQHIGHVDFPSWSQLVADGVAIRLNVSPSSVVNGLAGHLVIGVEQGFLQEPADVAAADPIHDSASVSLTLDHPG